MKVPDVRRNLVPDPWTADIIKTTKKVTKIVT